MGRVKSSTDSARHRRFPSGAGNALLSEVCGLLRPAQEVWAMFTQCSGERFDVMHVAGQDRF